MFEKLGNRNGPHGLKVVQGPPGFGCVRSRASSHKLEAQHFEVMVSKPRIGST